MPYEIERKYLIQRPVEATLLAQEGVRVWQIRQTYLREGGHSARVRAVREGQTVRYLYTAKRRINDLIAEEEEYPLDEATYRAHLTNADPNRATIEKVRYCIPHAGHTVEVDLYPFWETVATAEIELRDAEEAVPLPPYLTLIREVTAEPRYKNAALARALQDGDLPTD